jgi:hypothetical protein
MLWAQKVSQKHGKKTGSGVYINHQDSSFNAAGEGEYEACINSIAAFSSHGIE